MRNIYLFIFCISFTAFGQIPAGYYNTANGLTGYPLKTELSNIITANYNEQSYGSLITLYQTSDNDEYYSNQGEVITNQATTILDMYSENPTGQDPYNYVFTDNCGSGGSNLEGTCFNREHIFPQGFFSSSQNPTPRSDAHHVIPSDRNVNALRGSFPFGVVTPSGSGVTTTQNGSKLGPSITPGFSGTVFEPLDEFKGDIARMLLYFATRYESNINDPGWDAPNANVNNPLDGSNDQFYEQWYINLLLDWHAQDPVSQKELDRNNDIYVHQNNRNPFIDNPAYVNMIWTASTNVGSGTIFPTLAGVFVDTNFNGVTDAGDQIQYSYTIANIGTTTLYNLTATSLVGSINTSGPVTSIAPGQTLNDPFGIFTYVLTAADAANGCNCLINQFDLTADFNAGGTNGSLTVSSDDPDNFTNNDANSDSLPDDLTRTNFPSTGTGGPATELFFSEYIEGSGTENKVLELANYTGAAVDLSNYTLQLSQNGSGNWINPLALSGMLADQDVYVIARDDAGPTILNQADLSTGTNNLLLFNGNDAVGLFKAGVLLDIIGTLGSNATFAQNETLVRKPTVSSPNTIFDKVGEWDVLPINDISNLGIHNFGGTASINENLISELLIFPNPSNGRFYFSDDTAFKEMRVYDVSGRMIQENYDPSNGLFISRAGMYFVNISSQGYSKTFKVIVR